jgi:hypothetical protein
MNRVVYRYPEGWCVVTDADLTPDGTMTDQAFVAVMRRGDWYGSSDDAENALSRKEGKHG